MRTLFCLIMGSSMFFSSALPAKAEGDSYVLSHVNVIPMSSESILTDRDVWIENGSIKKIAPAGKTHAPKNVKSINARGKYLIPGLNDMHAHFFYEQGDNINTCEAELKVMLANGLTGARIQCGDSVYLHARQMVRQNKWIGPQLSVSSPQFVGEWPWEGKMLAMIVTNEDEAKAAVKKCRTQGYDEIKITFMVKRKVYDAIIAAAKEQNIKVTGHVGPDVKLPRALETGQQIEHMDEFIDMLLPDTSYNHGQSVSDMNIWRRAAWETVPHLDESKIPELVQEVKAAGICVTPTNFFFFSSFGTGMSEEEIKSRPDYAYIPEKIREERWRIRNHYWKRAPSEDKRKRYVDLRSKITLALWKAGVRLMAGSDSPEWFLVQGFSIHDELQCFVNTGLSPYAALQTATVNTAFYMGTLPVSGTVEEGKKADLVLLDANPLLDIGNTRKINAVISAGKYFGRGELDRMLSEARSALHAR